MDHGARNLDDLHDENLRIKQEIEALKQGNDAYYACDVALAGVAEDARIPAHGNAADFCYRMIKDFHELDVRERLNTSSYVNVVFENDELRTATLGMKINLADQTVYPQSFKLHNLCLNMVAGLWHCPMPPDFKETGAFPGAGTVGSTEACLLAGLCLKFRWRKWYAARNNLTEAQVRGLYPNLVISTLFQAAWEKLFRYMDIEAKFVAPSVKTMTITAEAVKELVDEKTIGVVAILGNHYAGQYDPVWEIDAMLRELNKEKGWEVGIHVDAASGGFIAPFQEEMPAWDFRLDNVLSISASGHKFGESVCGTGWVVWRHKEGLSEHVAISVSYLGGHADSYTLNFSRPASGIFVQYYKFHRLGKQGYRALTDNRMTNAKVLRDKLKEMKTAEGKERFVILDAGDKLCLPVVTARLNPDLQLPYDNIDFQHHMLQQHWYVSGYAMSLHDPNDNEVKPLFNDAGPKDTMFRVVVKANLTRALMDNLVRAIEICVRDMDALGPGFAALHAPKKAKQMHTKGFAC